MAAPDQPLSDVHYEQVGDFVGLLEELNVSVLVSTYQAGKLFVLGRRDGGLSVSAHTFEQPMGLAVQLVAITPAPTLPRRGGGGMLAVGARRQVWFLPAAPDLAPRLEPAGTHDSCFLTRGCHVTGEIYSHDLAWAGSDLWAVNTLFSCLCTLRGEFNFVPRWKPPFISALVAEDRCHLNGLALEAGRPRYVTALAECDTAAGWRPTKANSGCLIDVVSNQTVIRGLCMPHSPRVHDGKLWLLDSGHGRLSSADLGNARAEPVAHLPGYTRGLALHGHFAFVGLSRIRETSVFGDIPIAEDRQRLQCGVAVVDVRTGQQTAGVYFHGGVNEVFAVEVLPGARCPAICGPDPLADGGKDIVYVPV